MRTVLTRIYPLGLLLAPLLLVPGCGDSGKSGSDNDDSSATESTDTSDGGTSGGSGPDTTESGSESDSDTGEPEPAVPHALGTISLVESHLATGGSSVPSVSASFIPNTESGGGEGCYESVSGCRIALTPDCGDTCASDEYCSFNAACESRCQRICDAPCGSDEVCYFPAPDSPACKKVEPFDAGALTFLGTPIPINLFPPYGFSGDSGTPFAPGGEATVQASGAAAAGFEAFEKSFTGTSFLQTSPSLDALTLADIYGDGPLPVRWTPGADSVVITASVTSADFTSGAVVCEAQDGDGAFDIPRAALLAAVDGVDINGLSISVQRRRVETHKDLTTTGMLTGVTVESVGWLDIVTSSVESHTFEGCGSGELFCGDACVETEWDNNNCGQCGKKCTGNTFCEFGECQCQDGGILCGNACVDTYNDTNNCGGCGNKCPNGSLCEWGECVCDWPEVACGNSCVNTESDDNNCGGCGNACGNGQTCEFGECVGDSGSTGDPDPGTCCTAQNGPGCSNDTIEACVCAQDDYCCMTTWDSQCVSEVESFGCGSCG
ncbi:MAG: hypothetical protein H6713_43070 [Myxococcales bacterium]|nr:hypothetical protein [Myxococcales bacterium]